MKLIWKRTCSLVRPLLTEEGLSYFLLVVLMGITLATLAVTTNTTNTTNATVVGVYGGWRDADRVDSFYSWLDYPGEHYAHEFIDHRYGWDTIGAGGDPIWVNWVAADDANRRLTVSLPLVPVQSAGDFAGVASGRYDSYFRSFARSVAGTPAEDTIVRLGWEMNGNTFPWAVNRSNVGDYKRAWNHVVPVMKQEAPKLRFEWSPNVTLDAAGMTFSEMYPGDATVDYIGLGIYDYHWPSGSSDPGFDVRWDWLQNSVNGMKDHRDFAASHGKPMAYTEWSLWPQGQVGGGGDDPRFIRAMADWFCSNPVAYQVYNEGHFKHSLNNYPNSKAAYKEEFQTSDGCGNEPYMRKLRSIR